MKLLFFNNTGVTESFSVSEKFLSKEIYNNICSVASQSPRKYGLPKIHKVGVTLRPILFMVGSDKKILAKRLIEVLYPVLVFYSEYCGLDSFQFPAHMRKLQHSLDAEYSLSFDISSSFPNVPLDETIESCTDFLYRGPLKSPSFPEIVIVEVMKMATKFVSFSFNNCVYQEID